MHVGSVHHASKRETETGRLQLQQPDAADACRLKVPGALSVPTDILPQCMPRVHWLSLFSNYSLYQNDHCLHKKLMVCE